MRRYSKWIPVMMLTAPLAIMAGCCCHKCTKKTETKATAGVAPASGKFAHYGEPMKLADANTVPVDKVLAEKDKFNGQFVRVSGKVDSVCHSKGCWMRVKGQTPGETLFVKFSCPISGRLIPADAIGRNAVVEGTLEVTLISEEEARHYKEESGASKPDVEKISGPQKIIRMKSPAAMVENVAASGRSS